ncbi:MAG: SMP-30/gluconolactonase/LRE family protein [Betaproteobacteria bacterium]|nr:SMP-30/gluconolactonase/LRE family protein [Betaproteobacteria bacterium]
MPNFFAPPKEIDAVAWARLPDALRDAREDNARTRGQPSGFPAKAFLERPSFDREGNLWCVDIINGRLLTIDRNGEFSVAVQYDGWPNGLKIHRDGRVFIADYKHGIMVFDRDTREVTPLIERYQMERLKAVNDLFFARNGDLYFTDQGLTGLHDPTGRLFRYSVDGKLTCLLNNVPSPNGLVMNPEETQVLLAVTRGNCVWRVPLTAEGGVSKVGVFVQMSGGIGPDGLALDSSGGLIIAHVGLGSVWVMSPAGEPLFRIRSPLGPLTTNMAFGDEGNRQIYITESHSGTILRADLSIPGKTMYSHV